VEVENTLIMMTVHGPIYEYVFHRRRFPADAVPFSHAVTAIINALLLGTTKISGHTRSKCKQKAAYSEGPE